MTRHAPKNCKRSWSARLGRSTSRCRARWRNCIPFLLPCTSEAIGTALSQVKTISEQYVNTLVDSGRAYWRSVIDRLNKLEAMLKEEAGNLDAATYADQRAALQEALALAAGEMKSYTDNRVVEGLEDTFTQNVRGFTISVTGALSGVIAFL